MLRNGDFSACVFVDGVEVEYFNPRIKLDDSEEGQEVMHAYIVGEPGKNFTVSWKDHRGVNNSTGHIFVDGKDVASAIVRRGRGKPVSRSGAKVSATKLRPFKFAHLTITSDDAVADKKKDKETLKEMSTIRLAITYVQLGNVVPFKAQDVEDWGPVHEEAKALGLTTRYDPKIEIPQSRAVSSRKLNPDQDGPDVQFVFTYATREHLMAADIIPNPNAPKLPIQTGPLPLIVLEDEDNELESAPVTPPSEVAKRPRNNKRASSDADGGDEDEREATPSLKRPRRAGPSRQSSVGDLGPSERVPAASQEDDADIAELQRHMDEYNLRNSQGDGKDEQPRSRDENGVETAMRINEEESQDL